MAARHLLQSFTASTNAREVLIASSTDQCCPVLSRRSPEYALRGTCKIFARFRSLITKATGACPSEETVNSGSLKSGKGAGVYRTGLLLFLTTMFMLVRPFALLLFLLLNRILITTTIAIPVLFHEESGANRLLPCNWVIFAQLLQACLLLRRQISCFYSTVNNLLLISTIPYYTILFYILLYYPILYYTILYYTILYYTILYYILLILYYTTLYYTTLYYTILYYTVLYYTILYYTMLDYTVLKLLYDMLLQYVVLSYAMLCYAMPCYAMLCYAVLCYAKLNYTASFRRRRLCIRSLGFEWKPEALF